MKIEITKLYLVQVLDKDGNELAYEYVVGDKGTALQVGKELKEDLKNENNS
jgi:hypothetical protein